MEVWSGKAMFHAAGISLVRRSSDPSWEYVERQAQCGWLMCVVLESPLIRSL
jgi:hypothetical protein